MSTSAWQMIRAVLPALAAGNAVLVKHAANTAGCALANTVAPTFIQTPGTEPVLSDPALRAEVEQRITALHRIGEPDEVAGAVVFLCSPPASLLTGETLVIDGGWTVR